MFDRMMVRGLILAAVVASAASVQADVFNMGGTISGGKWTGLAARVIVAFLPLRYSILRPVARLRGAVGRNS